MFGKRESNAVATTVPKGADRILAEIEEEPIVFSIRARARASYPGGAKASPGWPLFRLEESSSDRAWILEETGQSFLLYRKSADSLEGITIGGKALDVAGLSRIQSEAAEGRAIEVDFGARAYRYRLSSRLLVSDEGERYRFLFEDDPFLLIVEAYVDRPSAFAVFEGRALAAISSAWKEGKERPR
jgi:hypothetical protein